jgi:thioredoxin 1
LILKFFAEWCGPCRTMKPLVDEVFNGEVVEVDIDTTEGAEIAERYGVRGVPTLIRVDADGEMVNIKVGLQTKQQLVDWRVGFESFL